jgi:hypothetical protein
MGAIPTVFAIMIIGSLIRAPLPPVAAQILVALVALAFLAREIDLVSFPLLQNARLVPQFVTRVPFWGSMQFGAEMGTGMRTYSPTGLPHIMVVATVFLASWSDALLAGTGFAIGRALMLLTFVAARDKMAADKAFEFTLPRLKPLFVIFLLPLIVVLVVR